MYTIDIQWNHSQQYSEAATARDRYSYRNTSATKPLITKQKAARLMYTIDIHWNHSQQYSESATAWDMYSYRTRVQPNVK